MLLRFLAAIELLNSRYADPTKRSDGRKLRTAWKSEGNAERSASEDWQSIDFSRQAVRLNIDGSNIANNVGTHPTGDPVGSVVALVNILREGAGVQAGEIMITGTWTGVKSVKADSFVEVAFDGFEPPHSEFMPRFKITMERKMLSGGEPCDSIMLRQSQAVRTSLTGRRHCHPELWSVDNRQIAAVRLSANQASVSPRARLSGYARDLLVRTQALGSGCGSGVRDALRSVRYLRFGPDQPMQHRTPQTAIVILK